MLSESYARSKIILMIMPDYIYNSDPESNFNITLYT